MSPKSSRRHSAPTISSRGLEKSPPRRRTANEVSYLRVKAKYKALGLLLDQSECADEKEDEKDSTEVHFKKMLSILANQFIVAKKQRFGLGTDFWYLSSLIDLFDKSIKAKIDVSDVAESLKKNIPFYSESFFENDYKEDFKSQQENSLQEEKDAFESGKIFVSCIEQHDFYHALLLSNKVCVESCLGESTDYEEKIVEYFKTICNECELDWNKKFHEYKKLVQISVGLEDLLCSDKFDSLPDHAVFVIKLEIQMTLRCLDGFIKSIDPDYNTMTLKHDLTYTLYNQYNFNRLDKKSKEAAELVAEEFLRKYSLIYSVIFDLSEIHQYVSSHCDPQFPLSVTWKQKELIEKVLITVSKEISKTAESMRKPSARQIKPILFESDEAKALENCLKKHDTFGLSNSLYYTPSYSLWREMKKHVFSFGVVDKPKPGVAAILGSFLVASVSAAASLLGGAALNLFTLGGWLAAVVVQVQLLVPPVALIVLSCLCLGIGLGSLLYGGVAVAQRISLARRGLFGTGLEHARESVGSILIQ